VAGSPRHQKTIGLTCSSLPVPDPEALDAWPSPVSVTVPLDHQGSWYVRKYPRRKRLQSWRERLTEDGATVETWAELLAAYDGGWTLPCPSPSEMLAPEQWNDAPRVAVEAVVDFLALVVAGVLSPEDGQGAAVAPTTTGPDAGGPPEVWE
jgi:hypothetical protein